MLSSTDYAQPTRVKNPAPPNHWSVETSITHEHEAQLCSALLRSRLNIVFNLLLRASYIERSHSTSSNHSPREALSSFSLTHLRIQTSQSDINDLWPTSFHRNLRSLNSPWQETGVQLHLSIRQDNPCLLLRRSIVRDVSSGRQSLRRDSMSSRLPSTPTCALTTTRKQLQFKWTSN